MADETHIVKLGIDASGSESGAKQFENQGQRVVATNRRIEESQIKRTQTIASMLEKEKSAVQAAANVADKQGGGNSGVAQAAKDADVLSKVSDRVITSLTSQQRVLDRVGRTIDPLGQSIRKLSADMETLNNISSGPNLERAGKLGSFTLDQGSLDKIGTDIVNELRKSGDAGSQLLSDAIVRAGNNAGRKLGETLKVSISDVGSKTTSLIDSSKATTLGTVGTSSIGNTTEEVRSRVLMAEKEVIAETELKRQVELEAEAEIQRSVIRKQAINEMLISLKQYQVEETKAENERAAFAQKIAPTSSVTQQRQFEKDLFDMETAGYERVAAAQAKATNEMLGRLKQYQAEQRKASDEADDFAKKMASALAPQTPIKFTEKEGVLSAGPIVKSADVDVLNNQDKVVQSITQKLIPYSTGLQKARADVANLNEIIRAGGPAATGASNILAVAQRKLAAEEVEAEKAANDNKFALVGLGKESKEVASAHELLSIHAQSAFHAMRGFTEQVAFGIPITRAALSEFNNVSFAMSGRGGLTGALTEVLGIFGRFLWPVAGAAAFAGAVFIVSSRVNEVNANLKSFQLSLDTVARGSGQTSIGLQKVVDDLKKVGVSGDDAKKSIDEILKATPQGLNPAFADRIVKVAQNISAVPTATTGGLTSDVQELTKALTGGVKGLEDYGLKLGALEAPEVKEMERLAKLGDAPGATLLGFNKIEAFFSGKYLESLTSAQKLTLALDNAWRNFVDKLASSSFTAAVVAGLTRFTEKLTVVLGSLDKVVDWVDKNGSWLEKFVPVTALTRLGELVNLLEKWSNLKLPEIKLPSAEEANKSAEAAREDLKKGMAERGSTAPEIAAMTTDRTTTSVKQQIIDWLISQGYTKSSTAAIVGNAAIESSFNPAARTGSHTGLFQWETSRAAPLAGSTDVIKQLQLMDEELTKLDPAFKTATGDVAELTKRFEKGFERSGGQLNEQRVSAARSTFAEIGGVESKVPVASTTALATAADQQQLIRATAAANIILEKQKTTIQDDVDVLKKWPAEERIARAALEARNAALAAGRSDLDADKAAKIAAQGESQKLGIEWNKEATIAGILSDNTVKTADAYRISEAAGLRQAAATEAINTQYTIGVPAIQTYGQILTKNAVEAVLSAEKETKAFEQTLTANRRLADATAQGTAQEKEAQLQNEAVAQTHNALTNAIALGNKALEERAQKDEAAKLSQLRENEVLNQTITANQEIIRSRNEIASTKLETQLTSTGADRDQISKQLADFRALLKTQQEFALLPPEIKQQYLDVTNQVGLWNLKLAEAERTQQRINDLVLNLADSIASKLTTTIEDAFDGKKAESWGDKVKSILKDITSQLASGLVIKPVLGTIAGGFGLTTVANQLGTVSGGTTTSGLATGNTGTGTSATTSAGIGGSNVTGAIGLGATAGATGNTTNSVTNYINNTIGPKLGFASTSGTIGGLTSTDLADLGVPDTSISGVSGGLFGSTTLTSGLGGLATGFGAGGLVSSLLGGNSTTGAIGGSVGGLVGTAVGGPVGGLIGGALGGLTGLFGNNTKSNNAAGTDINLVTGKLSRVVTSSDTTQNQNVTDITSAVKSFARTFATDTGVKTDVSLAVQSGVRDGIKVSYSGQLAGLGEKTFKTSAEAIDQIELDLAHNLTGVSGTLKTVLDQVSDPADISDAVTFAGKYDDLKKAADDAFSSISTDTDKIGPYADAFNKLNDSFDSLTTSAEQFGLSLDPINKGLDEATKRLKEDFGKSLDAALDTANAKDYINTLQDVSDAYIANVKDARAIGLYDAPTVSKLDKLEVSKARETLDTLTNKQLSNVVTDLKDTAPEISALAAAIIAAGTASDDTSKSLTTFADGLKNIQDTVKSLKSGELSGLTDTAATKEAIKVYQKDLDKAVAAGVNVTGTQLADLSTSATDALNASIKAYGNAPKTADLRRQILNDLKSITSVVGDSTDKKVQIPSSVQYAQIDVRNDILAAAEGSMGTAPGKILVGEKGPEWMLPKGEMRPSYAFGTNIITLNNNSQIPSYSLGTRNEEVLSAYVNGTSNSWAWNTVSKSNSIDSHDQTNNYMWGTVSGRIDGGVLAVPAYAGGTILTAVNDNRKTTNILSNIRTYGSYAHGTKTINMPSYRDGALIDINYTKEGADFSYAEGTMNVSLSPNISKSSAVDFHDHMMSYATGALSNVNFNRDVTNNVSMMSYGGGTVPGKILVGEVGPEWMLPRYAGGTDNEWGKWIQVGKNGPEIIDQKGGAIILPFPVRPKDFIQKYAKDMKIPAYAGGTNLDSAVLPNVPDPRFPDIAVPDNQVTDGSIEMVVTELRSLRKENAFLHDDLLAIKKQIQGGDQQAMIDNRQGNSILGSIDNKLGSGLVSPSRRAVG